MVLVGVANGSFDACRVAVAKIDRRMAGTVQSSHATTVCQTNVFAGRTFGELPTRFKRACGIIFVATPVFKIFEAKIVAKEEKTWFSRLDGK